MSRLLELWRKLPMAKGLRLFLLHLVNSEFLIGVTGVIFDKQNRVLIVEHTYRDIPWSLPGGFLQSNELPKHGLAREIKEETGFTVKIIRIIQTEAHSQNRIDMSYFGVYESGEFTPCDEVVAYKFVKPRELPPLIDGQLEQITEGLRRKKAYDRQQFWRRLSHFGRV